MERLYFQILLIRFRKLKQAEVYGETQGIKQISFVDAVDRASEAVVGVINIQRDNFSEADSEAGTGSGVIYKRQMVKLIL